MLLTTSINTGKFIMCLSEQELNLIGIAIRELRDTETEEPTSLDVILQVDAATLAESLRHQEETLGVDHGCGSCNGCVDRSNCDGCDNRDDRNNESTSNWIDGDNDNQESNI